MVWYRDDAEALPCMERIRLIKALLNRNSRDREYYTCGENHGVHIILKSEIVIFTPIHVSTSTGKYNI